jgi:hypothetical protein
VGGKVSSTERVIIALNEILCPLNKPDEFQQQEMMQPT